MGFRGGFSYLHPQKLYFTGVLWSLIISDQNAPKQFRFILLENANILPVGDSFKLIRTKIKEGHTKTSKT